MNDISLAIEQSNLDDAAKSMTMLDSHVHFQFFWPDYSAFIHSVVDNMLAHRQSDAPVHLAICLLEIAESDHFSALSKAFGKPVNHSASLTLVVQKQNVQQQNITVIRGQQLNTSEGLELVVLGCRDTIPSHLSAEHYIADYAEDHIVLLPWGFGKWLGKRGGCVTKLLKSHNVLLGDNAGRPKLWQNIPAFGLAFAEGIPILAGSDPLPIASHKTRAGAYGNLFPGVIDSYDKLKEALHHSLSPPATYGSISNTLPALMDQFKLRLPLGEQL